MNFVGVGVPELILIAVLALIFVGPQKLPEVMGQIGRTVREIRRQASEVTRQFTDEIDEVREEYREVKSDLTSARDQMREESASLNRDLRATVTDAKRAAEGPVTVDTTARVAAPGKRASKEPSPVEPEAPAPEKVVRLQRRSSKRQLPAPGPGPTNTNT